MAVEDGQGKAIREWEMRMTAGHISVSAGKPSLIQPHALRRRATVSVHLSATAKPMCSLLGSWKRPKKEVGGDSRSFIVDRIQPESCRTINILT
jgi:hypothetical protein